MLIVYLYSDLTCSMEEKISVKAIDHYSNLFVSKLADSFFQKKEKINGQEILSLCEIKQVNLLVVKELMRLWTLENEKWQSPFFNYEAAEVQQSMAQFKNSLSNNIHISKKDFLPLLKTAVSQTLFLVLAPYDFFSDVLDAKGNGVLRAEDLKHETRYLKINKAPLEKLVEKLEERKAELITGNEAFALLDHILEEVNFTPEDVDGYISSFSKVAPLKVEDLFESKTQPAANVPKASAKEHAPQSIADNLAKKKIQLIKESLTINQKFMFTKILFFGDFEIFSETIDRLDNFDNFDQAFKYISENHSQWDTDSEEYEEFLAVIQRRFP